MSTQILMPALSPTMEEGKLAKWHVKEGDTVKSGDILAEIETDKATMEFEAVDEGRIGKILVPEGAEGIKVNQPIAVLLADGEQPGADIPAAMENIKSAVMAEAPKPAAPAPPAAKAPAPATAPAPQKPTAAAQANGHATDGHSSNGGRVFASPLAKRIAAQSGIDISAVTGSGPRGRIVKSDVEAAAKGGVAKKPAAAVSAPSAGGDLGIAPLPDARGFYKEGEYTLVPHDSMRKAIARRLTSAKALIPHYYLTVDCNIDSLMEVRQKLNDKTPKGDGAYKLSVNDFIIKAAAMALMKHPDVNASWTADAMLKHKHADIGVAVDLNPGLITPIVFAAETRGLAEISNEVRSLAERAKAKKLKPSEYEGGAFSISNLGMFAMKQFTAVINPPQSAILAIGAGEQRPIVKNGQIVAATIMTVTMSCDHRVIDGATGARFLRDFQAFIEEPASMLL
jgi:pyruvate dehydrogenase E2 component (dihydrolipoamide acetyltransferase)